MIRKFNALVFFFFFFFFWPLRVQDGCLLGIGLGFRYLCLFLFSYVSFAEMHVRRMGTGMVTWSFYVLDSGVFLLGGGGEEGGLLSMDMCLSIYYIYKATYIYILQ